MPLAAVLLITPVAVAGSATSRASAPTAVKATARSEIGPAAARGVLAWSQNSRRRPGHYDLYVQRRGRAAVRINRRGTQAFTGDFDGSTLVYSQRLNRGKSNIRFLNLDTGRRRAPAGVNTRRHHENQPSRTDQWLLFKRSRRLFNTPQRIILRNLATGRQRLLATGDGARRWAQTGKVSGNFATYVKCRNLSFCNVIRYNIATHTTRRVPNPRHRALYAASVTANGTVYYAKGSRITCPTNDTLWKYTRAGRRVKLATLGPRFDTAVTSPVVHPNGSVDVYFDAFRARSADCDLSPVDIYKITVP
jgi:Tol biopolymer transport system component